MLGIIDTRYDIGGGRLDLERERSRFQLSAGEVKVMMMVDVVMIRIMSRGGRGDCHDIDSH